MNMSLDVPDLTGNLPPENGIFVGRAVELMLLEQSSPIGSTVIHGVLGAGKSALALRHAHEHRSDYTLAWWMRASTAEQVEGGLAELAAYLNPWTSELGSRRAANVALAWLQANPGCLLVLDAVDRPQHVAALVAQLHDCGRLIITTRRDVYGWRKWAGTQVIKLDGLEPEDAVALLSGGESPTGSVRTAAAEVAAELGHIPWALHQVLAHRASTGLPLSDYLTQLRSSPVPLLQYRTADGTSLAHVWDSTLATIVEHSPEAITVLMALVRDPRALVPRSALNELGLSLPDVLDGVRMLRSHSLLLVLTEQVIQLHPLVRTILRARHSLSPRTESCERADTTARSEDTQ
ncbi:hypothetical protein GCM10010156_65980 [Planobispora rosea]|uniref:NB-ARC domain-containing protein n=2 Tax=Planobispora rosea TaxID=35762 RepID=A0A8J3WGQ2_PLARO|nr:hypothetical protein GCM10010156_65980 [Planobispora rosea]GIH87962.1 hypothetical protein Pro02_63700 [Planobispora rosea]